MSCISRSTMHQVQEAVYWHIFLTTWLGLKWNLPIFTKQELTCALKSIAGLAFTLCFQMRAIKEYVLWFVWGTKGGNKLCSMECLEWRLSLVASRRNWVKLLSCLLSGSWVTTCIFVKSLLPPCSQSFILPKLLWVFHFPTQKNMNVLAWGDRFGFLWVLNMNSELSFKEGQVHKYPGKQKGKLYIIIPYFYTMWAHGKLTRIQLLQF